MYTLKELYFVPFVHFDTQKNFDNSESVVELVNLFIILSCFIKKKNWRIN